MEIKTTVIMINANIDNALTFASALKRVALTPGVLAIFWPTAAKMLQLGTIATCTR